MGMTIEFSEKGKVTFTVYYYNANMLEDLPEEMKKGE